MTRPPRPSPLLVNALLVTLAGLAALAAGGCQKDVQEVRRTKPSIDGSTNGYAVDTGKYSVDTGGYSVDSGRYSADTGAHYTVDGGAKPGAPSTPQGAPVGIGSAETYRRH